MIKVNRKAANDLIVPNKVAVILNQLNYDETALLDAEVNKVFEVALPYFRKIRSFLGVLDVLFWKDTEAFTDAYFRPITVESLGKNFMDLNRVEYIGFNMKKHRFYSLFPTERVKLSFALLGTRVFVAGAVRRRKNFGLLPHFFKTQNGRTASYCKRFVFKRRNINFRRRVRKQQFEEY